MEGKRWLTHDEQQRHRFASQQGAATWPTSLGVRQAGDLDLSHSLQSMLIAYRQEFPQLFSCKEHLDEPINKNSSGDNEFVSRHTSLIGHGRC